MVIAVAETVLGGLRQELAVSGAERSGGASPLFCGCELTWEGDACRRELSDQTRPARDRGEWAFGVSRHAEGASEEKHDDLALQPAE